MDGWKVGWSLEAAREGDRIEEGYGGLWMGVVVLLPRTSLLTLVYRRGGRIKAAPGEKRMGTDREWEGEKGIVEMMGRVIPPAPRARALASTFSPP
jgi:hypothetical protein